MTRASQRLERIEVRDAGVRLGRAWALQGIDFDLRAGERWWLLGANGAGKTLLLKLLRGDVWPTPTGRESRRYHFTDGDVQAQPLFASDRIAYLGPERQDRYHRHESTLDVAQVVLTGFDDSDLPLAPATRVQSRRIVTALRRVGLAGLASRAFLTLSYGQRRRVLLARALVREPDVLLLDEVLNGLDAPSRRAFLRALARAVPKHTAWIMTTHRRADAPPGITHTAPLVRGRLVEHGPVRRVAHLSRAPGEVASGAAGEGPEMKAAAVPPSRHRGTSRRAKEGVELLRFERAALYRGGRAIVGRFDWTLRAGEHWRIAGANGAGKSTLVAALYGDLWPAAGGRMIRRAAAVDEWKQGVGLISPELQATYAATGCTVEHIVASGLHDSIGLNEWPTPTECRSVARALKSWGLESLASRRARELSYGQLRLALAARAFMRRRRLLLLDEPYDGLDAVAHAKLAARVDRAVRNGATVVIATHHDEDVPRGVDRTLSLRLGRAPQVAAPAAGHQSGISAS